MGHGWRENRAYPRAHIGHKRVVAPFPPDFILT
jgi:hypothetical protein